MIIRTEPTGSGTRYFVQSVTGSVIAWFDSLDTAGTVLRYLKGAPMPAADAEQAHAAMIAFDARKEGEDH